ncbi:putative rrna processing protein [Phaeomoniella chlamydospora]|uniref:Putative rrna processing protein n=1 Tax=Phaeomoniella chlamydospora TaxID=158046 RepID=A0A0G2GWV1_PHACM|nr:putative rrna processing protein [Phaeomoniella chlamydospora]
MGRNRNLLAKLKNEKGFDVEAEKRRKQIKAAEKRKKEKAQSKALANGIIDDRNDKEEAEGDEFADFDDDNDNDSDSDKENEASGKSKPTAAASQEEDGEEEIEEDEEDEDVPLSDLSEDDRADTVPHQRLTINNTTALISSTNRVRIARPSHKFSVHNSLISSIPTNIPDPNDDLTRELEFYRVCQTAAREARSLLKKEKVPFTRPTDYFAEMVKSDEHMGKIKQKLYDEAARKKASSEARRQRDLKKFGKQVQVAKEQERAKEKRETLDKINQLKRKRKGMDTGNTREDDNDLFDIGVEDDGESGRPGKRRREGGGHGAGSGDRKGKMARTARDKKFGFGGKKRFSKSGDAASTGDLRGFSTKKMKGKGGAAKRPGKNRRAAGR